MFTVLWHSNAPEHQALVEAQGIRDQELTSWCHDLMVQERKDLDEVDRVITANGGESIAWVGDCSYAWGIQPGWRPRFRACKEGSCLV